MQTMLGMRISNKWSTRILKSIKLAFKRRNILKNVSNVKIKMLKLVFTYFFYAFALLLVFLGAFFLLWMVLTKEQIDLVPPSNKVMIDSATE